MKSDPDADPLDDFHPELARWFRETFPAGPTPAQRAAWPVIAAGRHALISAPTGSGKTFTAFLWALNQLTAGAWESGGVRVLYISPLKALNQDIRRNLLEPLTAIRARTGAAIRAEVRSGDTTPHERRRMLRTPPEILITTPESLNILLSVRQGGRRNLLTGIQHRASSTKSMPSTGPSGASTSSAPSIAWSGSERRVPTRGPLRHGAAAWTTVAAFVARLRLRPGQAASRRDRHPRPRRASAYQLRVQLARSRATFKPEKDAVFMPPGRGDPRHRPPQSLHPGLRERPPHGRKAHLAHQQATLEDGPIAFAHHGSPSPAKSAMDVEDPAQGGKTPRHRRHRHSLELGIDIGALDEVLMFQPPPSIAAAIQRLGRAGHQVGAVSARTPLPACTRAN